MKPDPAAKSKTSDRSARLAAALRDNLKKRKGKPQPAAGGESPEAADDSASGPKG
jgi:hypothetical protein